MSEETKKKVGQLIRDARKSKGLTQKELGEKLGVVGVTISDYETGRQNLTLDTLDKIAEALGVKAKITFE
ncbi:helix-turn-helix domain-containing protein [Spirosoma sp. HMF4905]|uniref:Helix-turn-helix domain-containing protein n=1 Tax=Spirosoma arboris TaxID=2682092 RepID=A0A7K1SHJ7_9BACT|nr:helix-turn-helix transcriptional regulator [Spirosoma arboris]MVM33280.1 helix-turn-helix domain-containing protein [Spirosoma arboris]